MGQYVMLHRKAARRTEYIPSKEEANTIFKLRKEGHSYKSISLEIGIATDTIVKILKENENK